MGVEPSPAPSNAFIHEDGVSPPVVTWRGHPGFRHPIILPCPPEYGYTSRLMTPAAFALYVVPG
jgi:hypothetical protein